MKKFNFKFTSVEKVRKTREDEALRGLGAAQRAYQEALAYQQSFENDLKTALGRRELLGSEPTAQAAFVLEDNFIQGTKQRIIRAGQGVTRAKRGLEKAMRFYLHARTQTRTVEVLKEKAAEEFRKGLIKHDQKQTDDLVTMRSRRFGPLKGESAGEVE